MQAPFSGHRCLPVSKEAENPKRKHSYIRGLGQGLSATMNQTTTDLIQEFYEDAQVL